MQMAAKSQPSVIRSVVRAISLLNALDADPPRATLSDFAERTGLAVSTVQRLVATLESEGLLRRLEGGRYTYGWALLHFGLAALQSIDIVEVARPHLRKLSAYTRETANLAVLEPPDRVLYVDQVLSPHALRHQSWLGRVIPVAGTAIGEALSGMAPEAKFAATRSTLEPDVTAIAVPVLGPGGEIAAAISITGPTVRISDRDVADFGKKLVAEAAAISRELGGRPRSEPAL